VLSVVPGSPVATSYTYETKIDGNLRLEDGKSYEVVVRIEWSPNLESIKLSHDAVVDEMKREAARTQEPIIAYLKQKGVKILSTSWLVSEILIEADANTILELATRPAVEKIFPNFDLIPFESEIGADTEFLVAGNSSSWNLEKVRAPEVWEKLGVRGENIRVGVVDPEGLDITHPEIAGTLRTDDSNDPTYPGGWIEFDSSGFVVQGSQPHYTGNHGTAVYGLILGQTTGMAPEATGMFALIDLTYTSAKAAMEWMVNPVYQNLREAGKPAHVSVHSYAFPEKYKEYFVDIIRTMWLNYNHFVVGIVYNDGEGTAYPPGMVYKCIAVGATDSNDNVAEWSGGRVIYKTEWSNPPEDWPAQWVKPDLSAPGVNVVVPLPEGQYGQADGTSFAAPHVAGAAVLMLSRNPSLPVQEIEDILKETAVWYDRYSSERPDTRYGWGRIDAFKAVLFAGFKATLVVPTEDMHAQDIAAAIKEEFAKVRVHVEIEERSASEIENTVWGAYWEKTWDEAPGYGWDMVWYEFNSAPETLEENLKSHYLANATPPDGGRNIMPWMDKEADVDLIRVLKAMAKGDAETVQKFIWFWQEEFMHNPPWIVIYYPKDLMFARGIAFNHNHPVLSHRYVRRAIAHAIPQQRIFEEILPSYGIEAWPGKAPIHPLTNYTDPSGDEVSLFNLELDPFDYNLNKAKRYLDMWRHSHPDTDPTKGPVGDHDANGFVELADFTVWVERLGTNPSNYEQYEYPYPYPTHDQTLYPNSYWPGNDVDPDNDNNDFVEVPDFFSWRDNIGKHYPADTPVISTLETLSTNNIAVVPQHTVNPALTPGMNFTISIYTDYNGTDVHAYQFTLSYNPSIIHGVEVVNGDLIVGGSAKFKAGTFDNENGTLSLTAGYYFEEEMTSGPGILANVTFTVVGEGASSITIGDETALYGLYLDWDLMDYVEYIIIDAETMPDHIQHGHFRNVGVTAGNTP
jgi:hypothetical protein